MPEKIQKITPFLWFNHNAEEAVNFYASIFKKSKILQIARYPEGTPGKPGTIMTINFLLNGQEFTALNGGPLFKFSEAISFVVKCDTQKEINDFSKKLSDGGKQECGWLKDKYGVSWQIVPSNLGKMIASKNTQKSKRVMQALLTMKKIDIKVLVKAYNG
jgi:predicted 3-demethylubiquinone-9 3-methyltransferase (glyoxalase superfamily)